MTDNSDFATKVAVRQKGLLLLRQPPRVLELYAGEGRLSQFWQKIATQMLSVEKDSEKAAKNPCGAIVGLAQNYLSEVPKFNVVDLDAYGLVSDMLKQAVEIAERDSLIFFTEFNPIRYKKNWQDEFTSSCMEMGITAFYCRKSQNSPVLYGFCYI